MIAHSSVGHYLVSFTAYTLLAVGAIYAAFLYLKQNPKLLAVLLRRPMPSQNPKAQLSVETMLPLEPRKSLYIIRSGQERFLVATSPEGTQFLSKLEANTADVESIEENLPDCQAENGLLSKSYGLSMETLITMRRLVPSMSGLQALKSIQQTVCLLCAKWMRGLSELFARLQYQFEKTSSSNW